MGDRYEINIHCAYCETLNESVWYAPTCGTYTFKCICCNKINFIISYADFKAKKIEDVEYVDVEDGFLDCTNVYWKDEEIKDMCLLIFKEIKNIEE